MRKWTGKWIEQGEGQEGEELVEGQERCEQTGK